MKNELKIKDENYLEVISQKGELDVLKPLMQDIHLFDTYISGINNLSDKDVLKRLKNNSNLILRRHDSKFDENEIVIYTEENVKLGIIPEADSVIFARLMDAGKMLKAKLITISTEKSFIRADIGIYLNDY